MIAISPQTAGSVLIFQNESAIQSVKRTARLQRTKTLDGSAVMSNHGVTSSDRTFTAKGWLSKTYQETAENLFETGGYICLFCDDGAYKGMIETFRNDNGKVKMTILAKEKIS